MNSPHRIKANSSIVTFLARIVPSAPESLSLLGRPVCRNLDDDLFAFLALTHQFGKVPQFHHRISMTDVLASSLDNSHAVLRPSVDAFFDKVMVNAEDEKIRSNRFGLLAGLRNLFLSIADISHLVPEKK